VSPVLHNDTSPAANRRDSLEATVGRGHAAVEDVTACPSSPKLKRLKFRYSKKGRRWLAGSVAASNSFAKVRKIRRFR
jgi:hypothetical protein